MWWQTIVLLPKNVIHILHYLKYVLRREPLAHCYNTAKLFLLSIRLLHLSQSVPTGSAVGLLTPFHYSLIFHPPSGYVSGCGQWLDSFNF